MDAVAQDRHIVGAGTPECAWQAWDVLHALPRTGVDALVPATRRLVVVAPHPDDEILMCGGLLAMLETLDRGMHSRVIAVTDGEASHPGSAICTPDMLAARRQAESMEGLRRVGMSHPDVLRLHIPDGGVAAGSAPLIAELAAALDPRDVVMSTWSLDGHPDHEATAHAAARACTELGCTHIQIPVWMWHWSSPGDARVPWERMRRLALSPQAMRRKVYAVAAHASQQEEQHTGSPPVLTPASLARLLRPFEYFVIPPGAAQ